MQDVELTGRGGGDGSSSGGGHMQLHDDDDDRDHESRSLAGRRATREQAENKAGLSLLALVALVALAVVIAGFLAFAGSRGWVGPGARGGDDEDAAAARHVAYGETGAIASTHYLATAAGMQMLEAGGNAFDAAAAVQFALNVVQPESTGIGGGCMPIFYHAVSDEVVAVDGREEAPEALTEDAFCADPPACTEAIPFFPDRTSGGHPVGVPGTLAATSLILEQYGTMTLAQVMAPAIKLARDGFPMSEHLHSRIVANIDRVKWFDATAELLLNADQTAPKVGVGETYTNPELAATFEAIAANGISYFYTGALASDIVAATSGAANPVTGLVGHMTLSDLATYKAVKRQPVSYEFMGHTVYGHAMPSSGGVTMALVLQMLDGLQLGSMDPQGAAALHRLIDAQNIAFADRNAYLGDPDFVDVPIAGLINGSYARQRRDALMKPARAAAVPVSYGYPEGSPLRRLGAAESVPPPTSPKAGTTHFSVVDSQRNVIAWTTTIEENLGSAVAVPGRGFLLNNELTDFDALPTFANGEPSPNRPQGGKMPRRTALGTDAGTLGGKRPRSSMSPTLVFFSDDDAHDGHHGDDHEEAHVLALGSPGGSKIIGLVTNVLVNRLVHGMTQVQATDAPRVVSRNSAEVLAEGSIAADEALHQQLAQLGIIQPTGDWGARPTGFVQSAEVLGDGRVMAVADTTRLPSAGAAAA